MSVLPVVSPNLTKVFVDQEYLLPTFLKFGSPKFRRWVLDLSILQRYHGMRDIADTWERTMTDIFEEKKRALKEGEEALERQIGQGRDLISILMKENMKASEEDTLPDNEVLGQARHSATHTY
ncbi:hypothetical protein DXG01_010434 [Tephrocybe rancida]|nr:hypothetical protein DXG01_010434 [Tephrocybe rancida]